MLLFYWQDISTDCHLCSLNLPHTNPGIPYTDLKYQIDKYIMFNGQDEWNNVGVNQLNSLKPVLGDWHPSSRRSGRDAIVLCHSCIGHTILTHSFILAGDRSPQCEHCQCILTVSYFGEMSSPTTS